MEGNIIVHLYSSWLIEEIIQVGYGKEDLIPNHLG